jgi:hypothetical protein
MNHSAHKVRKHLSADALLRTVRLAFAHIPEHRPPTATLPLSNVLMAGFALFALKDPSLLAFDQRRHDSNLQNIFGISQVPCDTQLRSILDGVNPSALRPAFRAVFRQLQRGKALEPLVFYQGCYLLALDGTQYFLSEKIHCASCLQKTNSQTGQVTYYHQLLGAVLLHPDFKEVIPLAPEPIIQQDGTTKNDCERNAARRFLARFRQEHPHLPVILVEDALSSNAPHIEDLHRYGVHYLLGVKEGDHAFLFDQVRAASSAGRAPIFDRPGPGAGVEYHFRYVNGVPLNASHTKLRVNFFECWEEKDGQLTHYSWVTDLVVTPANIVTLMRGGRARWKIENETFNTLKNQGYHFEHNYGHGEQHLSVVLALLMMLAFLVDQTQQLCSDLFRQVWSKLGSKRLLWERLRSLFHDFLFSTMQELYEALLYGCAKQRPVLVHDSS